MNGASVAVQSRVATSRDDAASLWMARKRGNRLPARGLIIASPPGLANALNLLKCRTDTEGPGYEGAEPAGVQFVDRDILPGQNQPVASLRLVSAHGDEPAVAVIEDLARTPDTAGAGARIGLGAAGW